MIGMKVRLFSVHRQCAVMQYCRLMLSEEVLLHCPSSLLSVLTATKLDKRASSAEAEASLLAVSAKPQTQPKSKIVSALKVAVFHTVSVSFCQMC